MEEGRLSSTFAQRSQRHFLIVNSAIGSVLFLQPPPLVAKLAKVVRVKVWLVVQVVPRATIFAALKLT
jgi:hypothetical protein